MIYLNKKQIVPAMILIHVVFAPIIVALFALSVIDKRWEVLLCAILLFLVYLTFVFFLCKKAYSKRYYLISQDDHLEVCFKKNFFNHDTELLRIPYRDILQMDYYRISSIKGWFILYSCLFPKSVFITFYNEDKNERTVFIGYMDLNQIRSLAEKGNVELVVH